ncbi:hypothetical protein OG552_01730 [Streptomyces sp. NBC_01476]|uniref:hypothetical protein n=1 Tax=Streptomyces sp. NBC_01476 TaxID=2903881 RepID=UPI002E32A1B2|nr:hypothetical protein [Streptomyces sp. NBC_01476]
MGESKNVGLAAAMAGGYALGRSKKGRIALTAAALLVGKGLSPRHAISGGIHRLPGVPAKKSEETPDAEQGEEAEEQEEAHHNPLARKARAVTSAAAKRPLTALTDALHERTLALGGEPESETVPESEPDEESAEEADDAFDGEFDDAFDEDQDGEEADEEPPPPAKPRRRPTAEKRTGGTGKPKSSAGRSAPGKPAASRKQAAARKRPEEKSAPAKRTAARKDSPTKKSASRPRRER